MAWQRLGRVWAPDGSRAWSRSHASHPFAVPLGGDRVRVFFGTRDDERRSSIGWVDAEIVAAAGTPMRVVAVGEAPVLVPGTPGHHDDSGMGMGSIVRGPDGDRLYYMGWNLSVLAPWRNSIGIAEGSAEAPAFAKPFAGPLLDRSPEDPYTLSYPWVMRLDEDDWRMWYGSNIAWGRESADMEHVIKLARSHDGFTWRRDREPALGFTEPGEYAMARPSVLRTDDGFAMWLTTRGDHYRIGAAVSPDGERWTRCDAAAGLDRAGDGWESDMVCYPCIFEHAGRRIMLYNGNGYGLSGFGMAEWQG